jgi:outer membrane protein
MPQHRFWLDLRKSEASPSSDVQGKGIMTMTGWFSKRCVQGVVSAIALFSSTAAWSDSLTDALIAAYNHSGILKQNQALLRAADEDVAQAVAALRPVIRYAATVSNQYPSAPTTSDTTASLSVTAEMLLYDFGRSQLSIDAAKETVLATREALVGVEQDILLRAVAAFFNVREAISSVQLQENNVRLLTQQLRASRDQFEVGQITRTDVSLAEARLAAARSGLAASQGGLAQAREEYRAATGRYPSALTNPPKPPGIVNSIDAAKAVARKNHPDIRQAQREITVADLNVARAEGNFRPSLSGSARIAVDDDGDDSRSLSLTLSGPIYQGGQLASVLRQFHARRDAARAALHTTRHAVEQEVGNAWANLAVASASLQATDQGVRSSRLALRGAREEFAAGARTTLDVLDLEQELLDAETNRVSAQVDRNVAVYQLLSSMGLLTVDHLNLGIPTYDASAYYNAVSDAPTVTVSPQGQRLDRVLKSLGKN